MIYTKIAYESPDIKREIFSVNFNDEHYKNSDPEHTPDSESVGARHWEKIFEVTLEDQFGNAASLSKRSMLKEHFKKDEKVKATGKCNTSSVIIQNRRDSAISNELKSLYDHTCQCCRNQHQTGSNTSGVETHHLYSIGEDGPDCRENMIVVCPNCHSFFDAGSLKVDLKTFKITHFDPRHKFNGQALVVKHKIELEYIKFQNAKYVGGL